MASATASQPAASRRSPFRLASVKLTAPSAQPTMAPSAVISRIAPGAPAPAAGIARKTSTGLSDSAIVAVKLGDSKGLIVAGAYEVDNFPPCPPPVDPTIQRFAVPIEDPLVEVLPPPRQCTSLDDGIKQADHRVHAYLEGTVEYRQAGIVRADLEGGLGDDVACVHSRLHEVDRGGEGSLAVTDAPLRHVTTGVGGKRAVVQIEKRPPTALMTASDSSVALLTLKSQSAAISVSAW